MSSSTTEARIEAVARQLGARIRAARLAQRITLEGLSERTGLSAGFLSRLERGETNASISNLILISGALGLALREFFDSAEQAPARPDYVLTRARERARRPPLQAVGYTYRVTSGDLAEQQMSVFELTFPVGQQLPPRLVTHEGEEVLYLLKGTIEFHISGDSFVMNAGDCVHFDCDKPHMGRNIGQTEAKLLMVVTPVHSARHHATARQQSRESREEG